MREELTPFELGQIWTSDDALGEKDDEQDAFMFKKFGTRSIPLHVIVAPDGSELARFTYSPLMTPDDYLVFLKTGLENFAKTK